MTACACLFSWVAQVSSGSSVVAWILNLPFLLAMQSTTLMVCERLVFLHFLGDIKSDRWTVDQAQVVKQHCTSNLLDICCCLQLWWQSPVINWLSADSYQDAHSGWKDHHSGGLRTRRGKSLTHLSSCWHMAHLTLSTLSLPASSAWSLLESSLRMTIPSLTIIFRRSPPSTLCSISMVECKSMSRPWWERWSPSRLNHRTPSTMSRQRFRTRRVFLLTSSVSSSLGSSWKMVIPCLTTTSKKNLCFILVSQVPLFFIYSNPLWSSPSSWWYADFCQDPHGKDNHIGGQVIWHHWQCEDKDPRKRGYPPLTSSILLLQFSSFPMYSFLSP